jgi:hypothetical protein
MVAREAAPIPETSRDYASWAHQLYFAGDPSLTDAALAQLREPTVIQAPALHLLRSMKHLAIGDRPGAMVLMRKAAALALCSLAVMLTFKPRLVGFLLVPVSVPGSLK